MDDKYDLVIIDVSPSITQIQTCAIVYTKTLLVPVAMDILSQGAGASIETAKSLNHLLKMDIRTLALLPVMVHRRMVMTELVMNGLADLSAQQPPQPARAPRRNHVGLIADAVAPLTMAIAMIGNNLNQIARQVNTDALAGRTIDVVQVRVALAAIRAELNEIREEVERAREDLSARTS